MNSINGKCVSVDGLETIIELEEMGTLPAFFEKSLLELSEKDPEEVIEASFEIEFPEETPDEAIGVIASVTKMMRAGERSLIWTTLDGQGFWPEAQEVKNLQTMLNALLVDSTERVKSPYKNRGTRRPILRA